MNVKQTVSILLLTFAVSFICACNAMTPGPSTTRSQAAPVVTPTTEVAEATTEQVVAASTEAYSTWAAETGVEETEVDTTAVYVYAKSGVNVRDAAGKGSNVIGSLSEGERAEKLGEDGNWVMISYNDGVGYVYNEYLTDEEP